MSSQSVGCAYCDPMAEVRKKHKGWASKPVKACEAARVAAYLAGEVVCVCAPALHCKDTTCGFYDRGLATKEGREHTKANEAKKAKRLGEDAPSQDEAQEGAGRSK